MTTDIEPGDLFIIEREYTPETTGAETQDFRAVHLEQNEVLIFLGFKQIRWRGVYLMYLMFLTRTCEIIQTYVSSDHNDDAIGQLACRGIRRYGQGCQ